MDLFEIYGTLHQKKKNKNHPEYTFFPSVLGMFFKINHILDHKTSLNKFKGVEIILSIFSNHNGIKLEISYKKKNGKRKTTWRLNSMLLKDQLVGTSLVTQ